MTRKFPFDQYDEHLHSANEKLSSQGLRPARENTGHTRIPKKALPTICQTLEESSSFWNGDAGRGREKETLIYDRLLVRQPKRSIHSVIENVDLPHHNQLSQLASVKLCRVTYNKSRRIGHVWGEPVFLVLPTPYRKVSISPHIHLRRIPPCS